MDSVRSGPFGQIFKPDNFIFGKVLRDFAFKILKNDNGQPQRVCFLLPCLPHVVSS